MAPTAASEVGAGQLRALAAALLGAAGVRPDDAAWTAELLVRADLAGHPSHGITRLADYLEAFGLGQFSPTGRPVVVRDHGSTAVLDGAFALGQVAARSATDEAITRARSHGISCVALRRSGHIGRLADFAERIADAGLTGLLFANGAGVHQCVAPPGGLEGRLSTNPLAFAAPRSDRPHLVFDMATSVVAGGKLRIARERGEEVPVEWGADGVLPLIGGHKGLGLALAVEALAGVLAGAGHVTPELASEAPIGEPQGLLVIAIEIERFLPLAEFTASLDAVAAHLADLPLAPGAAPVRLPGSRASRDREGSVVLTDDARARLDAACVRLGVEPLGKADHETEQKGRSG